ncbi:MAG: matrixin family metalloprotease [Acidobacteriota bacterium]
MKRMKLALLAACVSLAAVAQAGELRLKTRTIKTGKDSPAALPFQAATGHPRSLSGVRWRWLVEIESESADFAEWERRGARILGTVPRNGYIISSPEAMNWEGLQFGYRAPIGALDKLSPQIAAAQASTVEAPTEQERILLIVRFHKDVEPWEAEEVLAAEGIQSIGNLSLVESDRLVELTPERMAALALWDEVEYVFPAPAEMKKGGMYLTCGEVLNGGYEAAMLAASFGEGWDGPGRGRASLSYSFGSLGSRTGVAQTQAEIRRALAEWSKYVAVSFSESTARSAARNIDILFATGAHGDAFPFTSGSTVLGHSFYPANPNPEPLAGDIHINDAWSWSIGGQWDIYSVVLHEIGHSLGIGHTDTPGSVMYPYYQRSEGLKQQDIDSIRQLYAAADAPGPAPLSIRITSPSEGDKVSAVSVNLSGSIAGGDSGLRINWRNETSASGGSCQINSINTIFSCASIPLSQGANRLRITATMGTAVVNQTVQILREAEGEVRLSITSPAANSQTTSASEIQLRGAASHGSGIAGVSWTTDRGRSGLATGQQNWSATVGLETGTNVITVTATSRSGIASSQRLTVQRTATTNSAPVPPADPQGDKAPPRMTIQQPIGNFIITSAPRLTFRGTAMDNIAVTNVTWTNSAGDQSGAASAVVNNGTVSWSFDVNIAVGFNAIQVRAWDLAGNSTLYSTTVRRY